MSDHCRSPELKVWEKVTLKSKTHNDLLRLWLKLVSDKTTETKSFFFFEFVEIIKIAKTRQH